MRPKILVIGRGANGYGSALQFKRKYPDCDLTVAGEYSSPHTTSDVAAGFWEPYLVGDSPMEKILKWASATWDKFIEWSKEEENYGILMLPGVSLSDTYSPEDPWKDIVDDYHFMTEEEYKQYGPQYKRGATFTSLFAEGAKFLPILEREIKSLGGKMVQDKFNTLQEAAEKYNADLIINCSGLGARSLVPDPSVYPIRGQVFRVKAPWQKTFFMDDSASYTTYILPNQDLVILGGTHTENDWNTEVSEDDSTAIWNRIVTMDPTFVGAYIYDEQVGLRPGRKEGVRVEVDEIALPTKNIPVVHNYGHGGAGITMFWGTSDEATDLAVEQINKYFPPVAKL